MEDVNIYEYGILLINKAGRLVYVAARNEKSAMSILTNCLLDDETVQLQKSDIYNIALCKVYSKKTYAKHSYFENAFIKIDAREGYFTFVVKDYELFPAGCAASFKLICRKCIIDEILTYIS